MTAFTRVQSATSDTWLSGNALTIMLPNPVTPGNGIFIWFFGTAIAIGPTSISHAGQIYSQITSATNRRVDGFSCLVTSSTSQAITVNLGYTPAGDGGQRAYAIEVAYPPGTSLASSLANGNPSTAPAGAPLTPTAGKEFYAVSGIRTGNVPSASPGAPWSDIAGVDVTNRSFMSEMTAPSASGSYQAVWTSASTSWDSVTYLLTSPTGGAPGSYTLTASAAAFIASGIATGLKASRKLPIGAGSFLLTGNDAILAKSGYALEVVQPPECTLSGAYMSPPPSVRVLLNGVLDTAFSGTITANRQTGSGSTSGSTLTANVVAGTGIATFPNIKITGSGIHTLRFTKATETVDSISVRIRETPYATTADYTTQASIIDSLTRAGVDPTSGTVRQITTNYLLFVPNGATAGVSLPLIMYGHAAGQYTDPSLMAGSTFGQWASANPTTFPWFMLFPALSFDATSGDLWSKAGWRRAIPEIIMRCKADGFNIDLKRLYYYGYSTGGIHLPDLAYDHPMLFAAMVGVDPTITSAHLCAAIKTPPSGPYPTAWGNPYGPMEEAFYDNTWMTEAAASAELARRIIRSDGAAIYLAHGTDTAMSGPNYPSGPFRDIADPTLWLDAMDVEGASFARVSGSATDCLIPSASTRYCYQQYGPAVNHGLIESTVPSSANKAELMAWFADKVRATDGYAGDPLDTHIPVFLNLFRQRVA